MGRISWKIVPRKKENEKQIYTGYHFEVNTDNNNEALYYLKPYTFNANDWAITWFSCVYKIHAFSMTSLQSHVYMQNSLLVESVAWCVFCCASLRVFRHQNASEKVVISLKIHVFIWPNQCAACNITLTKICLIPMFPRDCDLCDGIAHRLMYLPLWIYDWSKNRNEPKKQQHTHIEPSTNRWAGPKHNATLWRDTKYGISSRQCH